MRKLLLSFALALMITAKSQNTFPSSGNVGVGTTSPSYLLHIANTGWTEQIMVEGTQDSYATMTFKSNGKQWNLGKRPGFENNAFQLYHHDGTNWSSPYLTVMPNGNAGIGTANPNQKFVVAGNSSPAISIFDNTSPTLGRGGALLLQHTNNNNNAISYAGINAYAYDGTTGSESGHLILKTMRAGTLTEAMRILNNGNVGIGTVNAGDANYKLFVETGIRTRKVKVDVATWADYVFSTNYKLPTLKEVEAFIKQHNHLPDVPSEAEVKKEGLDLGENQAVLLKKIEELTLYIIDQNKKLEDQNKRIEHLEKRLSSSSSSKN